MRQSFQYDKKMKRVNEIISDRVFISELDKINEYEKDRIYCRHGFNHLLDVARIAYIESMEKRLHIDRELIYAAAMLHDIGRARQYEDGEDHDKAGYVIAKDILQRCHFTDTEAEIILAAVGGHRKGKDKYQEPEDEAGSEILTLLIRDADNKSRICFRCAAFNSCKWSEERKNKELNI